MTGWEAADGGDEAAAGRRWQTSASGTTMEASSRRCRGGGAVACGDGSGFGWRRAEAEANDSGDAGVSVDVEQMGAEAMDGLDHPIQASPSTEKKQTDVMIKVEDDECAGDEGEVALPILLSTVITCCGLTGSEESSSSRVRLTAWIVRWGTPRRWVNGGDDDGVRR
ncbi:hypothetical protein ACLOJK_009397 [Asimina triloba]